MMVKDGQARAITTAASKGTGNNESRTPEAGGQTDTAKTLAILRAILDGGNKKETASKVAPRRPKTPVVAPTATTKTHARSKSVPAARTTRTAGSAACPKAQSASDVALEIPLEPSKQRALASSSFNSSLKILNAYVKKRQERLQAQSKSTTSISARSTKNAVDNATQGSPTATSSDMAEAETGTSNAIIESADCAALSLEVLRTLRDESKDAVTTANKREQGALILLDRTISLDLIGPSLALSRGIHRHHWPKKLVRKDATVADMLMPEISELKTDSYLILASFQSQLLRLAILQQDLSQLSSLVSAVDIDRASSPANIVQRGVHANFIDAAKATAQLHTVSQALLKLYTQIIRRKVEHEKDDLIRINAYKLFIQSMLCKIKSWKLVSSSVDVKTDIWLPVEQALRRLYKQPSKASPVCYEALRGGIQKLQMEINGNIVSPTMTSSLQSIFAEIAESNHDFDTAVRLLKELAETAIGEERFAYQCRCLTLAFFPDSRAKTLLDDTTAFTKDLSVTVSDTKLETPTNLLVLARLRKVLIQALPEVHKSDRELSQASLDLIYAILSVLWRRFQAVGLEARKKMLKVVLRSIETVIEVERYAVELPALIDNYADSLSLSSFSLKILNGEEQMTGDESKLVHSMAVKVSNIFWRLYKSNNENMKQRILLARSSINAANFLPVEKLQGAALGPKLENLSKLQLEAGQDAAAAATLRAAIKHYIGAGGLDDAADRACSAASTAVWTCTDTIAHQLARTLRAFLSTAHKSAGDFVCYDDLELESLQRFVLLEHQLIISLESLGTSHVSDALLAVCEQVATLSLDRKYRALRLRLLSRLAYLSLKHKSTTLSNLILTTTSAPACMDVEHKSPDGTTILSSFLSTILPLLQLQLMLMRNEYDIATIEELLKPLHQTIAICTDEDAISAVVDDNMIMCNTVIGLADLVHAVGRDDLRLQVWEIMLHLAKHTSTISKARVLHAQIQIAACYLQKLELGQANSAVLEARKLQDEMGPSNDDYTLPLLITEARLYLLSTNFAKVWPTLQQAQSHYERYRKHGQKSSSEPSLSRDLLLADALDVASLLAFHTGQLQEACLFSRQAVKITSSHWAALEDAIQKTTSDQCIEQLTSALSNLQLCKNASGRLTLTSGPRFWKVLPIHLQSLNTMFFVSQHQGLYADAAFYGKKASALMTRLAVPNKSDSTTAQLALLHTRAKQSYVIPSHVADASLESVRNTSLSECTLLLAWAETQYESGDVEAARKLIAALPQSPVAIADCEPVAPKAVETIAQHKRVKMNMAETRAKRPGPQARNTSKASKGRAPKTTVTSTKQNNEEESTPPIPLSLSSWLYEDKREALCIALGLRGDKDFSLKSAHVDLRPVYRDLSRAHSLLQGTMQLIADDTMAALFADSAVALPAKNEHRRISFLQGLNEDLHDVETSNSLPTSQLPEPLMLARQKLQQANASLKNLHDSCANSCTSIMLTTIQKLRSKISLVASTLNLPFSYSPASIILETFEPKAAIEAREMQMAEAEKSTQKDSMIRQWPALPDLRPKVSHDRHTGQEYGDLDIPSSWTVISIGISEETQELNVSKMTGGSRSPFLIRIPLSRSNEGDDDNEFTFDGARKELDDIIHKANESSHHEDGHNPNTQRVNAWNKSREALDLRLATFLRNIDNIWLGGFKGIFAPYRFDQKHVARFGKALSRTLDQHLPSRQKPATPKQDQVEFHDHILELFLGLNTFDEEGLDDAIMDLLYFVVDILQFSGERNAYDEIDWDRIMVDVLDALHAFHAKSKISEQQSQHTILIVDKELTRFPWESLPCLQDQPISRMSSLAALVERIRLVRDQSRTATTLQISKSASKGAYILNPSNDLGATQKTFEPILRHNCPSFDTLNNDAPSEAKFSLLLSNNDLLLYFGHGSGAQYIRGRTIRNLSSRLHKIEDGPAPGRPATTFLMGCSSAKMTQCGKFESYGMPGWYMLGGAPAVVGTLWDVTDRDIDRFALSALSEWGILEKDDTDVRKGLEKAVRAMKRRHKAAAEKGLGRKLFETGMVDEDERGRVNLDEAVRRGRDACLLRYLNGAAVVVYGIPISIVD